MLLSKGVVIFKGASVPRSEAAVLPFKEASLLAPRAIMILEPRVEGAQVL